MKIQSIEVVNFKAIQDEKIDFNGASAIITGGNNQGNRISQQNSYQKSPARRRKN